MEFVPHVRSVHARRNGQDIPLGGRQPHSRNHWVAGDSGQRNGANASYHSDGERWERGSHRGGRARGTSRGASRGGKGMFSNVSLRLNGASRQGTATPDSVQDEAVGSSEVEEVEGPEEPVLDTQEERDKFYQELVKARELERKKAIAEGKMDDPAVPKRLEDAISVVGTCPDMCPRFERYRRERENNLFEWETIPGTKRVDHKRAVKMYERAAGDKTLPSDLRPPHILKRTLDYLFHDLLPRGGFSRTFDFIRDRSRAVRNDFTMQHSHGSEAIECHDRCARFHILALHFERDRTTFSIPLEEQQLMNTLQSLKEFYEEQRGHYESPTELEMRVYHRLIHIRDQKERHEDIPEHITSHPVFRLTTDFRLHVQRKSAPISKNSDLVVDAEGMQIFGKLANVLREQGSVVMIYLVACILERLFGKDAIDDIEAIRGGLSISDIIDGISSVDGIAEAHDDNADDEYMEDVHESDVEEEPVKNISSGPAFFKPDASQWPSSKFNSQPTASTSGPLTTSIVPKPASAFSTLSASPNVFGTPSPFGTFSTSSSATSAFGPSAPVFGVKTSSPSSLHSSSASSSIPNGLSVSSPPANPSEPVVMSSFILPIVGASSSNPTISSSTYSSNPPQLTSGPSFLFDTTTPKRPSPPSQETGSVHTAAPPATNGFPTNAITSSRTPALNPNAPTLTLRPTQSPSMSSFGWTFERSANPSPIPIPPASNAPPTLATPIPSSPPSVLTPKPSPANQQPPVIPPLLPKINTSILPRQPASPSGPPLLPKQQPISLPSTPTMHVQPSAVSNFLKRTETTVFNSNTDILSPLYLPSPSASQESLVRNFSVNGILKSMPMKTSPSLIQQGKAPVRSLPDNAISEELEVKSLAFAQKSILVKECFERWQRQTTDRAAWIEACRQSDAYREKIQGQRHLHTPQLKKKRRISSGPVSPTALPAQPQRKRAKKRVSDYQLPRTDEELARRFKENHQEHERRWAHGTFLQVIRSHVNTRLSGSSVPVSWRIWLSMNPESDATAIWLERKFDVPDSGHWVSEIVFSIPLIPPNHADVSDFPGLIVFESTPLEGVLDDLERKYRILDDCARLRDIVKSFPPKQHFLPSLLVLSWTDVQQAKLPSDLIEMINTLVQESSIQNFGVLSIASAAKDLDDKLLEALESLSVDLEGKLIRSLTIRSVYKLFEPLFTRFMSEWIENCSINGRFDWDLFGQVLGAGIAILNEIAGFSFDLITVPGQNPYPSFTSDGVMDNDSAYECIVLWLSSNGLGASADRIARDLQSHRDIGQDFPARLFIEHLWELTLLRSESYTKRPPHTKFHVLVVSITSRLESYDDVFEPHRIRLGQALNMSTRRSPKRRSISEETDIISSQLSKRRRLSSSVASSPEEGVSSSKHTNGRDTPSPSNTTVSLAPSESTVVTVAMLRSLTRDMKKRYSGLG